MTMDFYVEDTAGDVAGILTDKKPASGITSTTKKVLDKTKQTASDLTIKFADLIVTAFGIVAALSWNDAIRAMFVPGGIFGKFSSYGPWVVAVIITLFALAVGYWRSRLLPTPEKKTI